MTELPQPVPVSASDAILIARFHQAKRLLVRSMRLGLILIVLGVVMVVATAIATMGNDSPPGRETGIVFAGLFVSVIGIIMLVSASIGRSRLPRSVVAQELKKLYPDQIG